MSLSSTTLRTFTALLLFAAPFFAAAQAAGGISLSVSPEFPAPYASVTVALSSVSVDLNSANITWNVNGKTALSGKGQKSLTFTVGVAGESVRVSATVTAGGETSVKSSTIIPGEIDLVWEASDSYVPPFYRGKALPSSEGMVRVVAIPNMRNGSSILKADNLAYKWKRNGKTDLPNSGFGKTVLSFKGGYEEAAEVIDVAATTADGAASAAGRASIIIQTPLTVLYENRPLEGIHYEEALPARLSLDNEEIGIVAEPYFFSALKKAGLSLKWMVNREETVSDKDDASALTLRVPKNQNGIASLFYSVTHPSKFLQSSEGTMLIRFNGTE